MEGSVFCDTIAAMSWASRRRTLYLSGVALFLLVVIGIPLLIYLYRPPTCTDGIQNQEETSIDRGGPCSILDERFLSPHSVLWSRAFRVRDGSYNAVAYIQNPNDGAGVLSAPYRFSLYDENNILVAEAEGTTFVMPLSVTPVFVGPVDTGNRIVTRTFFEFTGPLTWQKLVNVTPAITVSNKQITHTTTMPRVTALASNTSVAPVEDMLFVAVAFDPAGNAFAASRTIAPSLAPKGRVTITFTWPEPFPYPVGRLDILTVLPPGVEE
jgi:hypothetical protein